MSFSKLQDSILDEFLLNEFGPEFFKPGLDRITTCFRDFNSKIKSKNIKIITIAGTNGKGETAHFLNNLLISRNYKTALWTSPHVLSTTERFKFLGKDISHDELLDLFKEVSSKNIKLSYYEFLFFCFCQKVLSSDLDYIILEVGLGGRLDTTNLLDADYTLLTSISRDHEEYLGRDLVGILKEKLGITRASSKHYSSLESKFLRQSQSTFLEDKGVSFIDLFEEEYLNNSHHFSNRNQILASYFFLDLCKEEKTHSKVIDTVNSAGSAESKGRMEIVTIGEIKFIFIGAHNIDGIRKTVSYLVDSNKKSNDGLICAFSKRPIEDILSGIKSFVGAPCLWESIYVTEFKHPKAFELDNLKEVSGVQIIKNWNSLLDEILKDKKGQWIVSGSYYFIGEVQKYLSTRYPSLEL
jgi:dihydrofolate synthase/folylpolyglutamate synthase